MTGAAPSLTGGQLGRYELHGAIARGGMATVYVARMTGAAGFARTVAVKRLHPHLAADPTFSAMFVDEARLAARIRHPNVIDTLDVVSDSGELFLVMDFVLGETLAKLVRAATQRGIQLPAPVVSGIVIGALEGLHAAHEATSERGEPLGIVHRDISPQNILVARDGVARVLDFGVAKAAGRTQETEGGELKGKLAYMAPEQLTRKAIDRRCDLFAMGVVLWETLTSKRLFASDDAAGTLYAVLNEPIAPPSSVAPGLTAALDEVVMRALERDPSRRYATAQDMAVALEAACPPAPTRHAGKWVEDLAGEAIRARAEIVRAVDNANGANSQHGGAALPADEHGSQSRSHPVSGATRIAPLAPESWRHGISSVGVAPVGPGSLSGVSSVSLVTSGSGLTGHSAMTGNPAPPDPGAKRSEQMVRVGLIALVLSALLTVGIVMMVISLNARAKARLAATASSSASAEPSAHATLAPTPPPTPMLVPAVADETPKADPSAVPASASVSNDAAASAPTTPPTVVEPWKPWAPATAKASSAKPAKSAADCENPFTIDASGIKRPKPQCFGK